jgi:hypothetical protein
MADRVERRGHGGTGPLGMWPVGGRELCLPRTEVEGKLVTESDLSLRAPAQVAAVRRGSGNIGTRQLRRTRTNDLRVRSAPASLRLSWLRGWLGMVTANSGNPLQGVELHAGFTAAQPGVASGSGWRRRALWPAVRQVDLGTRAVNRPALRGGFRAPLDRVPARPPVILGRDVLCVHPRRVMRGAMPGGWLWRGAVAGSGR